MKKLNPLKLLIYWILSLMTISILLIIYLSITSSGGEQLPLIFLGKAIPIAIYGIAIISLLSFFVFKAWSKKNWYINVSILIACSLLIYYTQIDNNEREKKIYTTEDGMDIIKGDTCYFIKEYYSTPNKALRSEKYWVNGKKDSTWTIFALDGRIIEKVVYKKGEIVKKIK